MGVTGPDLKKCARARFAASIDRTRARAIDATLTSMCACVPIALPGSARATTSTAEAIDLWRRDPDRLRHWRIT